MVFFGYLDQSDNIADRNFGVIWQWSQWRVGLTNKSAVGTYTYLYREDKALIRRHEGEGQNTRGLEPSHC